MSQPDISRHGNDAIPLSGSNIRCGRRPLMDLPPFSSYYNTVQVSLELYCYQESTVEENCS